MLTVLVLANLVALAAIPLWAMLADRIGRKPVFIFGAIGCAVLIWPYIWAISQSNLALIFGLGIICRESFTALRTASGRSLWRD